MVSPDSTSEDKQTEKSPTSSQTDENFARPLTKEETDNWVMDSIEPEPEDESFESMDIRLGEHQVGAEEPRSSTCAWFLLILLIITLIVILIMAVIIDLGISTDPTALSTTLSAATVEPTPELILVDSRSGVVLMVEKTKDQSRIIVEKTGQASWLIISKDDTSASEPSLSPNGTFVAYTSKRNGGEVIVVSLENDARQIISQQQIEIVGSDPMRLCPWTPIAWDPESSRVAFFACSNDPSVLFNIVLVGELTTSNSLALVPGSRVESSIERELRWLDENRIIINAPATDSLTPSVTTVDINVP